MSGGWKRRWRPRRSRDYGRLAAAVDLPIASDLVYNRWQVRELLLAGGVDVVQPDVCRAGGITECRRIASWRMHFTRRRPRTSASDRVFSSPRACIWRHRSPNQSLMEFWYGGNPLGAGVQKEPFRIEDGYFWVPEGPGLGMEINEDGVAGVRENGMRIKDVDEVAIESFVVRAPLEGSKPHWGAGFWADESEAHPGFPAGYPGRYHDRVPACFGGSARPIRWRWKRWWCGSKRTTASSAGVRRIRRARRRRARRSSIPCSRRP